MNNGLRIMFGAVGSLLLAVSLAACGGGGGGGSTGGGGGGGNTITIKGNFSGGIHARSPWLNRLFAWMIPSAHALNPTDVSKVMVFQGNGGYSVSAVTDGNFSVAVDQGAPVGLISVGANNNYLGYLTLNNGVDSIPLTKLGPDVTAIDLQTLSSAGLIVVPSHNPIGSELLLTSAEQLAIAQGDNFFASLIKNPDADGNGTIDFLDNKFFRPYITYFITGGSFGANLTPTATFPAPIDGFRFGLHAKDTNRPSAVSFTGPQGSGLANSLSDPLIIVNDDNTAYGSQLITSPAIPPAGQYLVSYKTGTLTFNISDQSSASNVILAVPTVTLNGNGTMNKVTWVYKPGSGGAATLDPQAVISSVMLQIEGFGPPCASYLQGSGRIYNADDLPANTVEHVLIPACQNLSWSNVSRILMAYNDVYGNHNVVAWSKQ